MAGNPMISLIRPEALQGKAYARLAHPPLIANPSLKRPLLIAAAALVLVVSAMAAIPIKTSYRGYGVVAATPNARVIRSTRSGQVVRLVKVGDSMMENSVVAVVEQALQTEGGGNPAKSSASRLAMLSQTRQADLRLLNERYMISSAIAAEEEKSLNERLEAAERLARNQGGLVAESETLLSRVAGMNGHVTRLDTLALAERTVNARNRLIELQAEQKKLKSDLADKIRSKRLVEIDHARDVDRTNRQYESSENELLEKATAQSSGMTAGASGTVSVVYKRIGDWVSAGDEIALLGDPNAATDSQARITLQVPAELANLLNERQVARVWPGGSRRGDPAYLGGVFAIEQRTAEGYRLSTQQPGGVPGSFVAHIAIGLAQMSGQLSSHGLRPGSEVEVEIVFGARPLYEALLPRRLTRAMARGSERPK